MDNLSYFIHKIYYRFIGFQMPVRIVFLFWTIACFLVAPQIISESGIGSWLAVIVAGIVFYCGIIYIVCRLGNKKKYYETKKRAIEKWVIFLRKKQTAMLKDPMVSINYDYMDGHEFENYCAELLKVNAFQNVVITPGSGDQGIDIIAYKDGIKYGIQCKCYSGDIGNKAVQEAFSGKAFYGCHVAVVLTNRYFTKSAKDLAEKNGVLLWDRDKLNELVNNAKCK